MRAVALLPFLIVGASFIAFACGASLPRPPRGAHAAVDFADVGERPPAPRVEDVGAMPEAHAVWIDGEWSWSGRRWTWRRGGWVLAPEGATFAPWAVQIDADGRVMFAPGTWRNARGEPIDAPPALGARRRASDSGATPDASTDGGAT